MRSLNDSFTWQRMSRMINDLLIYSGLDNRIKPFAPTDCENILDRVLLNLQASIRESGAQISRDSLPTVIADKTQLLQVFQNLIDNAIKFRGEANPRVHISASR